MSADQLNEAISAFQSGDRDLARSMFQEVITTDPNNDTAWYYFAALQDDPARRRAALQRVLEINPQHQRAREVLDSMGAAPAAQAPAAQPPSAPAPVRPVSAPPPAEPGYSAPPRPASPAGAGFAIPFSIPGAPERATLSELWQEWLELFMAGVNVLMRKPGAYEQEIARATWWRFWLLVGGLAVISAVLSFLGYLLFGGGLLAGLISAIATLILSPGITYTGVWLSYWWARKQGTAAPQAQHALTVALPGVPASVITAMLSNLFWGFGGLLGFIVSIYAWYLMALGLQSLHQFRDPNQQWITAAFYILGVFLGGIVLGIIVGILIAPFAVAAAVFR